MLKDLRLVADEERETHISSVFFVGDSVFKIKKSVDLGFLNYSTSDRRRAACEAEVRLNRRLAPDAYQGVTPIVRGADGVHRFGGPGTVVDWAVHMRRLPDADRADLRLASGTLTDAHLSAIVDTIVRFHAAARADASTAQLGGLEQVQRRTEENFQQTATTRTRFLSDGEAAAVEDAQRGFLRDNAGLFRQRAQDDFCREGHGDLRLEQIYVDDGGLVTILDCVEFDERYRCADVAADIAFLAMDFAFAGNPDRAERTLALYAAAAGDFGSYRVIDFYIGYRAYVRAKVATLLADDPHAPQRLRERAETDARRHYSLTLAGHRLPIVGPRIVAIGGMIGTGKSTLAEAVSLRIGAPVVNTDLTRKQLLGFSPTTHLFTSAFEGAYDPAVTEQVYAEVFRRAEDVVSSARPVILDASFRTRALRARAQRLAESLGVPFLFLECRAPVDVCRERLQARDFSRTASDGRVAIFDALADTFEPPSELPAHQLMELHTTRPADELARRVGERLGLTSAPPPRPAPRPTASPTR